MTKSTKKTLLIIGAVVLAFSLFSRLLPDEKKDDRVEKSASNTVQTEQTPETVASEKTWSYSNYTDEMTSETGYEAIIESDNTIEQEFPYGKTSAYLRIVKQGNKNTVLFNISDGQIMGDYTANGHVIPVEIRFDSNKAKTYSFYGSSDNDPKWAILQGAAAKEIINKLKSTLKTSIRVTLYQAGSPTFKFNTNNLKWTH